MSEELGQLFRQLREKKGYSIDDIQEITKIRSRYIQDIENGRLNELPGNFYAKAFIKSYGEVVGLDPEAIEQYQNAIPDNEMDDLPSRTAHSLAKPPSKIGKYLKKSFVYGFIIIALLLVYMVIVSSSPTNPDDSTGELENSRLETSENPVENTQKEQSDPTVDQNQTTSPQVSEQIESTVEVVKVSTTSYKNRSKDTYEVVQTSNNSVEVQLNFNDNCWYEIRKGGPRGKLIVMNTLGKGQSTDKITLDEEELWIHMGNASGVQLVVNDKSIVVGNEPGPKYISIQKKK